LGGHRVKAMFHSTAMVPDYDEAVTRLAELFGLRVLEYTEATDPAIARRGGMTWIGDGSIEIGQPIVADAAPDRFVHHTGGGMHSVAVWVDVFAATVEHLEGAGVRVPVRLGGFGFSSPRDTDGLLVEWSQFTVDEDPRLGADLPPLAEPAAVAVTHHAFAGAVVVDPIASARRLATLLGTPITFETPGAADTAPAAGVSLGDCTLALYRLPDPDTALAIWGRRHERPGVCALGLRVDDLAVARHALDAHGVTVLHEGSSGLILDRATTGGIEVVVVDALLPGDPRGSGI
jgi:catechol 2,3-dioxygenase-like lactoylglutathione lyase family enzyme